MVKAGRFRLAHMTQEALADRCGVTRQTIMSIERGETSPNLVLSLMICSVLGLSLDSIMRGSTYNSAAIVL